MSICALPIYQFERQIDKRPSTLNLKVIPLIYSSKRDGGAYLPSGSWYDLTPTTVIIPLMLNRYMYRILLRRRNNVRLVLLS
jgi:UbiD family decarboxylase